MCWSPFSVIPLFKENSANKATFYEVTWNSLTSVGLFFSFSICLKCTHQGQKKNSAGFLIQKQKKEIEKGKGNQGYVALSVTPWNFKLILFAYFYFYIF